MGMGNARGWVWRGKVGIHRPDTGTRTRPERENIPVLPNLDIFQISPNILDFHSDAHWAIEQWCLAPVTGAGSRLLHTRHFFLSWVHIPDSPPYNGHNLFVASDPGEKIKLYFCVNTGCGMRCCPLQSSFFTWLIPVIRSGESRQGRAGAGGSGSHFLALSCVWPSSARVSRLRPPPTRGRTHTVTLCWRIFK